MLNPEDKEPLSQRFARLLHSRGLHNPLPFDALSLSMSSPRDAQWGEFHAPNPLLLQRRDEWVKGKLATGALRVGVFGSFYRGLHVVHDLLNLQHHPDHVAVVTGLCTDDAATEAKITAAKRVWQYIPPEDRHLFVNQIMNLALEEGIPVYTGAVKSEIFRKDILPKIFNPEVIIMATFGQKIDREIFQMPQFGMYNVHPSDLAHGKYPGANPFYEMIQAGEDTTRLTVHSVEEDFDTGKVIGFSPEISIEFAEPALWRIEEKIIALHQKTAPIAALMARKLLFEIRSSKAPAREIDFEAFLADECLTPESLASLRAPIKGPPDQHIPHRVA